VSSPRTRGSTVPITALLRETVFMRDAKAIWEWSEERIHHHLTFKEFLAQRRRRPLCLVELLDPPASARCSGRSTLEHVKDQLRMGKKAPDDEQHLVILCEFHNVWSPPSKVLREKIRWYLANAYAATSEQGGSGDQPSLDEER
jgi:hypothetical protein